MLAQCTQTAGYSTGHIPRRFHFLLGRPASVLLYAGATMPRKNDQFELLGRTTHTIAYLGSANASILVISKYYVFDSK